MPKDNYDVIDLKALKCFFIVAKHKSIKQASIELNISEPAVFQRIKQLEQYLGVKLYESRGGRIRLTPSGEHTMEKAITVFGQCDEFQRAITKGEETTTVTIATFEHISHHLLLTPIASFIQGYPQTRLHVLNRSIEDIIQLVRTNEVDFGIIAKPQQHRKENSEGGERHPTPFMSKDVIYEKLATYHSYLIMPKGHPLVRLAKNNFQSILNRDVAYRFPLMINEGQITHGGIQRYLESKGLPFITSHEVSSPDTLKKYVGQGLGVAIVSGLCLNAEDESQMEMVKIPTDYDNPISFSEYGMVIRKDKYLTKPLESLIKTIRDHCISTTEA